MYISRDLEIFRLKNKGIITSSKIGTADVSAKRVATEDTVNVGERKG